MRGERRGSEEEREEGNFPYVHLLVQVEEDT